MNLPFVFNDGGRAAAGYKGEAGDCVTRAIAIATGRPYQEIYDALSEGTRNQRGSRGATKVSARNGVSTSRKWFKTYLKSLGWKWIPTMQIGSGCKVHLRQGELPMGRLIVRVSKHLTAVIDGVIHDNHDCGRGGDRCVYGYWISTSV
jgi:hypothetical protein